MTKPIAFQCPHGKHLAYYHGDNFAGCLIHGRLLYTDIPQELKDKKNFKTQLTRAMDSLIDERVRLKKRMRKALFGKKAK